MGARPGNLTVSRTPAMADAPLILSKSAFAARRGVGVSAISKFIARGHISGAALIGGRINVEVAETQLSLRLDAVRSVGAIAAAQVGSGALQSIAGGASFKASLEILQARALSASVDAERKRRELNAERGKYVLAEQARGDWARTLTEFLSDVEQSFGNIAENLRLDGEQLAGLRKWWRDHRSRAAEKARASAATLPEFVGDAK
jgi:hypothetical protein